MSSILAIDPEILLIGLAMPLGVALIVGMAALLWRKRNGNGQRHVEERHVEEVLEKAIDPDSERTGEMSVAFWKRRFDSIDEKLDEILALLGKP